jgi:hypothetical protein
MNPMRFREFRKVHRSRAPLQFGDLPFVREEGATQRTNEMFFGARVKITSAR